MVDYPVGLQLRYPTLPVSFYVVGQFLLEEPRVEDVDLASHVQPLTLVDEIHSHLHLGPESVLLRFPAAMLKVLLEIPWVVPL
jgi:hypothetical protein